MNLATLPTVELVEQIDWLDDHYHAVDALLTQQLFVPLWPQLVEACGSLKAALMLGEGIRITRLWCKNDQSRNGWFWLTAAEWQDATSLSPREQESARQDLVDAGLWEERRTHNPSRLYYRLLPLNLADALGLRRRTNSPDVGLACSDDWHWDDALDQLLSRAPLHFYKALADLCTSTMGGLILCRLLYEFRLAATNRRLDSQRRFPVHFDATAQAIGMGAKAARRARQQLRAAGFLQDTTLGKGAHAVTWVTLNLEAIRACLQAQPLAPHRQRIAARRSPASAARRPSVRAAVGNQVEPSIDAAMADLRQSLVTPVETPVSPQMDLLSAADAWDQGLAPDSWTPGSADASWDTLCATALLSIANTSAVDKSTAILSVAEQDDCPFVDCATALLSTAYTERNYREPTPTVLPASSVDNPAARRSRSEGKGEEGKTSPDPDVSEALIIPAELDRTAVLRLVATAPEAMRQEVLDELAGQLAIKRKKIDSPMGYLHLLCRKAAQGDFVLTVGRDVAAARAAREAARQREAQALASRPGLPCPATDHAAPPSLPAAVPPSAEMKARLQAARASLLRPKLETPDGQ